MSDNKTATEASQSELSRRWMLGLGFVLVIVGMTNTVPAIPGLEETIRDLVGNRNLIIRKFPYEYLFPMAFVIMMTIVVLKYSFYREYKYRGTFAAYGGLAIDLLLIAMSITISLSYLIEIDSVCLIDQFTGERAELITRALQEEKVFAKTYGLPIPESVDDPSCINTLGVWIFAVVAAAIAVFLIYNVKVWGLPLVAVAILIATYTLLTVLIWYYFGADDINRYLVTKLGTDPRQLIDGRPKVQDILVNNAQGLLGRFMQILLNTVFPYIVLGSLFGVSAGGRSLIKLAFLCTRSLRGGPAHAAIVSSAMFGTISGGPVVNVLSTGVLTIPMMLKRGFKKTFAGGIEAAASSGGQIMPPVMGVAAFVLSAMTAVPYREVIIAAMIPATAYFGCLFLNVVFQARKQGITAQGEITDEMRLTREDALHLIMIFGPILLIMALLMTPKEAIGCGSVAAMMGVTQIITDTGCQAENLPWLFKLLQNSVGDAASAGWWATALLAVLYFLDRDIRRSPGRLFRAFADAGVLVSTLYLMFLAVSVIDFCLNFTGLSNYIARDIIYALGSFSESIEGSGLFLFPALLATMLMAVLLGMGMPTVPAYINVALLIGPILIGLGIATFTAHMFVFYFAVASAITPPVAVAAFAAASITKADPMATGISAVRSGIVMFVIPFVFAYYPELLLIPAAQIQPGGSDAGYLPGYDGSIHWDSLMWLLARLMLSLYLLASVLSRFDRAPLSLVEMVVRLGLAAIVISATPMLYSAGVAAAVLLLIWHTYVARKHTLA